MNSNIKHRAEGELSLEATSAKTSRVPFCVPVEIKPDGGQTPVEGFSVNLSPEGIAIACRHELHVHELIELSLSFSLGSAKRQLLAEVMWHVEAEGEETVYGLHFIAASVDDRRMIREAYDERASGRSGAWPLPQWDLSEAEVVAMRLSAVSRPLFVLSGAALGIALTVGFALYFGSVEQRQHNFDFENVSNTEFLTELSPEKESIEILKPSVESFDDALLAAQKAVSADKLRREESALQPTVVAQTLESTSVSETNLPQKVAPLNNLRIDAPIGDTLQPLPGSEMTLALLTRGEGDEAADVRSFWLESPKRLVVDVMGKQNGFQKSEYTIEHPIATRLRVGSHPDKVRFVIETLGDKHDAKVSSEGAQVLVALR